MTLRHTIRSFTFASVPTVLLMMIGACAPVDGPDEQESEPSAEEIDLVRAGTIDCTRDTDTGYVSGSPYAIEVVHVDGKPAKVETADAYWVMRQAALQSGVTLRVVSGFRTQSEQRYLYHCYTSCSCNSCNLAARPGYSNHQSGRALDLNTSDAGVSSWLRRHAAEYGFERTVPSEAWHYELLGRSPSRGPCLGGGASTVELTSPAANAAVDNNVRIAVQPDMRFHHLRYSADGYFLGASEDASDGFAVRYSFDKTGARTVDAVAYDADDRELARGHVSFTVRDAGAAEGTVAFTAPSDMGFYANGVDLKVDAGEGTAKVAYYAGAIELATSSDAASNFAARYVFQQLGYRALTAVASAEDGRELARTSLVIRVLPGSEEGTTPGVAFLARTGDTIDNGTEILVAGSDSIVKVALTADGYAAGEATRGPAGFSITRTFSQTGERRLVATGYDANGAALATQEIRVTIR